MPNHLKAILSIIVAVVAITVHYFQGEAGMATNKWLALALGAVMIGAIWLFPEAGDKGEKR